MAPLGGPGIAERLASVRAAIAAACRGAGREEGSVTLLAVSKTQPLEAVTEALRLGQRDLGENYAQELRDKARALGQLGAAGPESVTSRPAGEMAERSGPGSASTASEDGGTRSSFPALLPTWHFIGTLQRNKVNLVVGTAALVHTVDGAELAAALAGRARRLGLAQDCLVEVAVAGEAQKGGCAPAALPALLDAISAEGGSLRCRGLMCIPPATEDPEAARPHFHRLRKLLEAEAGRGRPHVDLRELSMGMSHDFAIAIQEGATIVRVGTAIFGSRVAQLR